MKTTTAAGTLQPCTNIKTHKKVIQFVSSSIQKITVTVKTLIGSETHDKHLVEMLHVEYNAVLPLW